MVGLHRIKTISFKCDTSTAYKVCWRFVKWSFRRFSEVDIFFSRDAIVARHNNTPLFFEKCVNVVDANFWFNKFFVNSVAKTAKHTTKPWDNL